MMSVSRDGLMDLRRKTSTQDATRRLPRPGGTIRSILLRMSFLRIAAIGLLGFILRTSAWAVPPHPTVLLVEAESSRLPVIKVIGTDPVVPTQPDDATTRFLKGSSTRRRFAPSGAS